MKVCQLQIQDEVNVKIKNLDAQTRRELNQKFKYFNPAVRFVPAVQLGRWDGTISFFTAGGNTYFNLLEEILPYLEETGYEIELQDERKPFEFYLPPIDKKFLSHVNWPSNHPTNPDEPIVIKDHQLEIVQAFCESQKGIVRAATAAGKTLTLAILSMLIQQNGYGRSVIVVPSKDLVDQTYETYSMVGLDAGRFHGGTKEIDKQHVICTWQSLNSLDKKAKNHLTDREFDDFFENVGCIIVDEVHSAKADVLKDLLTNKFNKIPIRWGLSGTLPKEDFNLQALNVALGPVLKQIKAAELQERGILSNCNINIIQFQEKLNFYDYHDEQAYLCKDIKRLTKIAGHIENQVLPTGNTIILLTRIETGRILEELIKDSVFVQGATSSDDRKAEYDEVQNSKNKLIIATYGVASVGINIPRIFNLCLIEPGKSFIRTIQSIGRSLRRAKDKDHAVIWDYCSNTKYSGRHLRERKKFYKEEGYPFQLTKVQL